MKTLHENIGLPANKRSIFRSETSSDKQKSNEIVLKGNFGFKRFFRKLCGNDSVRNFFRHLKGQTFTMYLYAQEVFLILYR